MTMHSITDIARQFNRTVLYCRGLQERFGVAIYEGSAYSNAYVAWFKTIIHLRSLGISEDALLKLWNLEKKILQLLQIDAVESPTWYLDSCGKKLHRRRRLLLTNYDIKFTINANKLQLGINFHPKPVELFNGTEMGEDVLNVLQRYREQYRRIVADANTESRQLASAAGWGRTLRAE
jgi:hypothetical protein